jgi:hypothetical protein
MLAGGSGSQLGFKRVHRLSSQPLWSAVLPSNLFLSYRYQSVRSLLFARLGKRKKGRENLVLCTGVMGRSSRNLWSLCMIVAKS